VYRYISKSHSLEKAIDGNTQEALRKAALGQSPISAASAVLVITGIYERSRVKYGDRAERYVHIETGAASENIYLQCESLGLGTVYIGAFRDEQVQDVLQLDSNEYPLAILPVGKPG
jgi:SagB-type dehydrogenase family enzyme